MKFLNIQLRHLRNIVHQDVEFGERINVFVGDNGQGKTNLLEALYLTARGKSFRTSNLKHLITTNEAACLVRANIEKNGIEENVEIKIGNDEKQYLLNQKRTNSVKLAQSFPIVLFSPESLQSIKEGPDERRRLIDEMTVLLDPSAMQTLSEYDRVLKTKTRVLKDYREGTLRKSEALSILESLHPSFLEKATQLTYQRLEALRDLIPAFKTTFRSVSNAPSVDISVDYVISDNTANQWSQHEIHNALHQRTLDIVSNELESGLSLVGPHRHEIYFVYNGNDSRFFCSQGQQRAIILSFKIAQVLLHSKMKESAPVLLLDDVLSELDSERRDYLIHFLRENSAQTIVTTTDLAFAHDLRTEKVAEYAVKAGQIQRHS